MQNPVSVWITPERYLQSENEEGEKRNLIKIMAELPDISNNHSCKEFVKLEQIQIASVDVN